MPRTAQFTKDDIAAKAIEVIRRNGPDALSARSLGAALGCSSRPVFTVFKNMEEVSEYTRNKAFHMFEDYVEDCTEYDYPFKEYGMRLIRFARKEQNMFNYLFLSKESVLTGIPRKAMECLKFTPGLDDLSEEQAATLYEQLWIFACGLFILCSKESDNYPEEKVSEMLSRQFASNLGFIRSGRPVVNPKPVKKSEGRR